jgi:hypothetical protein
MPATSHPAGTDLPDRVAFRYCDQSRRDTLFLGIVAMGPLYLDARSHAGEPQSCTQS